MLHRSRVEEDFSSQPASVERDVRLIVKLGGCPQREVAVAQSLTIGREQGCDLVIDHASVSRRHAEIRISDKGWLHVADLASLNGTFVNGQRLASERDIYHADEIWIGEAVLLLVDPGGPTRSDVSEDEWNVIGVDVDWDADDVEELSLIALSCDVRGCASLAQRLPVGELQAFMREWLDAARALLGQHGALLDGADRDSLLVYWPIESEEAPGPRVGVALRAAEALERLALDFSEDAARRFESASFEVRVGLHLGRAAWAPLDGEGAGVIAGPVIGVAERLRDARRDPRWWIAISWQLAQWAPPEMRFHNLGDTHACDETGRPIAALALDPRSTAG